MIATLEFLRQRFKYDTVAALRNSPLHMTSVFPEKVISKAEEKIGHDDTCYSIGSHKMSDPNHPYPQSAKQAQETSKKVRPPA